jgi:hypothetical protein
MEAIWAGRGKSSPPLGQLRQPRWYVRFTCIMDLDAKFSALGSVRYKVLQEFLKNTMFFCV